MHIDTSLNAIISAKSLDDLSALLFRWREETGLANLVYHVAQLPNAAPPVPILLLTYDPAWVKHYIAMDYFQIDPVVSAGNRTFLPIDWMEVDHDSAAAIHFFKEAESYGVGGQGYTIPIQGPFGERALFTLTSNDAPLAWVKWRHEYLRDYHLLGHYFHDRVMRLANARPRGKPSLSRRELQCLSELGKGRTPQQVAGLFDISESAVNMYLRSARQKLAATTNEHAIVKALAFELFRMVL